MRTIAVFHCTAQVGSAWCCAEGLTTTLARMGHRVINCAHPGLVDVPLDVLRQANLILLSAGEWYANALRARYGAGWHDLKMPKAAWYAESFHRDDREFDFATCRDLADRHYFPALQDAEEFHGEWLPFGVDTELFKPKPVPKMHDAAFLGSMYPKRIQFVKCIRFPLVHMQPVSAPDPVKSFELLADAYNSTKVFVNLPSYSRLLVTKVTEVMACRTLLVTPAADHWSEARNLTQFENRKHLVYYAPGIPQEIEQIVRYYLAHEREREAIAEAGYQEIVKHHRLETRLRKILHDTGND